MDLDDEGQVVSLFGDHWGREWRTVSVLGFRMPCIVVVGEGCG